jgi:hypothetical protein
MDIIQRIEDVSNEKEDKDHEYSELHLEELFSVGIPFEVNDCLNG